MNIEKMQDVPVTHQYPFSVRTFELLQQLDKNSNLEFYLLHKDNFKKYVEEPFQGLFRQVLSQLPDIFQKWIDMQTEIFSYPRWNPHYTAYLLAKEATSITAEANSLERAQINIFISPYILGVQMIIYGELNQDRIRFFNNIKLLKDTQVFPKAVEYIKSNLPKSCYFGGGHKELYSSARLSDWLNKISRKNTTIKNVWVSFSINKDKIIDYSDKELIHLISQTLKGLFPLFLIAIHEEPMIAVREYLEYVSFESYQCKLPFSYQSISFNTSKPKTGNSIYLRKKLFVSSHMYVQPLFAEIYKNIQFKDLYISERQLRCYHLALKTKQFVILSGISGTGKTWLTKTYADAAKAEYLLVPVAPNWTTNEDLLGYFNPIDKEYHHTAFSHFLERAAEEYKQAQAEQRTPWPYHLVLDEMNLARVEYYFAKFLSAMEIRIREEVAEIELAPGKKVLLPPNLYFIGTVNMDETTHGFADKVYDRAQLIELEVSRDDLYKYLGEGVEYRDVLMQIWDEVHEVAPFAFRVLGEIKTYVKEAEALNVSWQDALDEQLLQKILPKLKGTDERVGEALTALADITEKNKFSLSHKKVKKML